MSIWAASKVNNGRSEAKYCRHYNSRVQILSAGAEGMNLKFEGPFPLRTRIPKSVTVA